MEADWTLRDLSMLQMSDSFFPTGLYATSSGLEALVSEGQVSGRSLSLFISAQIEQQLGPCDCVALMRVVDLADGRDLGSILEIDGMVNAIKSVREAREASCSSGIQLVKTVAGFSGGGVLPGLLDAACRGATPCTYPVAFGVCAHSLGIGGERAALSFLYGFAVSVVGAAIRLGTIQHFEGQEIIHGLKPAVAKAVQAGADSPITEMWQFFPYLDICQMKHERMDPKMFIT